MHRVLFLLPVAVVIVVSGLLGAKVLDPYPAPRTAQNVWAKAVTLAEHQPAEETQQWYINQILATVTNPSPVTATTGVWNGQKVAVINTDAHPELAALVLPADSPEGQKWVDVNLTTQTLLQMEGNTVINSFKISSGVPWHPTPTGDFHVWLKVRDQTMEGGSKAAGDYYYLPHVHNISYFYGGYGLHAAYWHHNFGHPMSHGCINMTEADAATIFNWDTPNIPDGVNSIKATDDNPGTLVHIHT